MEKHPRCILQRVVNNAVEMYTINQYTMYICKEVTSSSLHAITYSYYVRMTYLIVYNDSSYRVIVIVS